MSLSTQNSVGTAKAKCCTRPMEKVTESHMFNIMGYSLDKDIGKGDFIESTIFSVDGYDWSIWYYPNGDSDAEDDDISIFLHLKRKSECVKAQVDFTILDQSGCASPLSETTKITNFEFNDGWGFVSFCRRAELESNIKDDCFIIKSVVTVFKIYPVESTGQVLVPPGTILQQIGHLLENRNGADVTFDVDGQTVHAHKCILAARSPVFSAQFFGPLKEKSDTIIKIEEMVASGFKAMLHFIYYDSFSGFEEIEGSEEKLDAKLMAQHLLVAADRYGLERLKIICEEMLCGGIDMRNVVTLLSVAERHRCFHLKTACLKFLASRKTLGGVLETEQFQCLVRSCPSILKELLESKLD